MDILNSKFIAEASKILDNNNEINWYNIAEMYNLQDEIFFDNGWGFKTHDNEVILHKIINKDKKLLIPIISFISTKFDLPELEELLQEYNLYNDTKNIKKKLVLKEVQI